ncbi:hypothetical protein AAG747_26775 [Rapidithrix thailandica]|uniref:Antitoxin component YwqK of YwqJK toxin-antitoxin module n=1 Tax=Rapidithrix thailandica TaxID=413964 RepID=A0AAW9S2Y4_9BACT
MTYRFITFLILIIYTGTANAQSDTLWFDNKWVETSKEKAAFYRPPAKKKGSLYRIKDYYIDGSLQMAGLSKYPDSTHFEGKAIWYKKDGSKFQELSFKSNQLEGVCTYYYNEQSFRRTPREETYKDGILTKVVYWDKDKDGIRFEKYYENGEHIKSVYFNAKGTEIGSYDFSGSRSKNGVIVDYYSNPMQIEEIKVLKNGYELYSNSFYHNGQTRSVFDTIQLKETFFDDKGHEIGKLQYSGTLDHLKYEDGKRIEFDSDGISFKRVIEYKDGVQTRIKKFTKGQLTRDEFYKNNKSYKIVSYDQEGKQIGSFQQINEKPHGTLLKNNGDIVTYDNGILVKAIKHYYKSKAKFCVLENSTLTYYDLSGNILGSLVIKVAQDSYYPERLESGGYSTTPIEGTLFEKDYQNRIVLKALFEKGVKTQEITFDCVKESSQEAVKCFQKTEIYNEKEQLVKQITYFSNGHKRSEITYKPGSGKRAGLFFDETGQQISEYDYSTKTGTEYKYFDNSDLIKEISQRENGVFVKQKIYQKIYDKQFSQKIVLREEIDFNGEAEFYSKQGELIAKATFVEGKATGSVYEYKSHRKVEVNNGVKNGNYIQFERDEKTIKEKGYYLNDEKHGTFTIYRDGIKKKEESYEAGDKEGYFINYDKKGNEISRLLYKNNKPYEGKEIQKGGIQYKEKVYKAGKLISIVKLLEKHKIETLFSSHNTSKTTIYDNKNQKLLSYHKTDNQLDGEVIYYQKNKPKYTALITDGVLNEGDVFVKPDGYYKEEMYSKLSKKDNILAIETYNKKGELLYNASINLNLYATNENNIIRYKLRISQRISELKLYLEE